MRKRTLLAVAFAGGMLLPRGPVLAEESTSTPDEIIKKLATFSEASPEARASSLLRLALYYQMDNNQPDVAARFGDTSSLKQLGENISRRNDMYFGRWAERLAREKNTGTDSERKSSVVAEKAIAESLKLLSKATNPSAKFNLYFITSCLAKKTGNKQLAEQSDKDLEIALQKFSYTSTDAIIAARSVLDLMAYKYVPVKVSDFFPRNDQKPVPVSFSEADFKAAEKLRLRGVAMVDGLPTTADARRKAHRDMSLWYTEIGKSELAEKEKKVLFELVGINDDRLLYPSSAGCGRVVWWHPEQQSNARYCGMG